uniref:Uncharacterized protein n=1 Tax=Plectus sambesii TaxID=2011161 RepID=A0A914VNG6_9BILA
MKGVTEEQLIECAKSFAKDLKIMDFFHSKISNVAATNILLADLCSNLPDVSTDMYSFNFSPLTAS